jgi:hypothetical protein
MPEWLFFPTADIRQALRTRLFVANMRHPSYRTRHTEPLVGRASPSVIGVSDGYLQALWSVQAFGRLKYG